MKFTSKMPLKSHEKVDTGAGEANLIRASSRANPQEE